MKKSQRLFSRINFFAMTAIEVEVGHHDLNVINYLLTFHLHGGTNSAAGGSWDGLGSHATKTCPAWGRVSISTSYSEESTSGCCNFHHFDDIIRLLVVMH